MKTAIAAGLALVLCAIAQAGDPGPSKSAKAPSPRPAAAAAASTARPASPDSSAATPASDTARPPLDLRIGDVRKYMMPNDYRAAISAPDAERDTVIVEADRPAPLLESEKPQPVGLGAVYSLFRHPATAWRLFLPDTSAYAAAAGPPDVVPQKEFRWGP